MLAGDRLLGQPCKCSIACARLLVMAAYLEEVGCRLAENGYVCQNAAPEPLGDVFQLALDQRKGVHFWVGLKQILRAGMWGMSE